MMVLDHHIWQIIFKLVVLGWTIIGFAQGSAIFPGDGGAKF